MQGRIRTQEFAATFDTQLGAAKRQQAENRDKEAKRLAFYIFWNAKRDFERWVISAAVNVLSARGDGERLALCIFWNVKRNFELGWCHCAAAMLGIEHA